MRFAYIDSQGKEVQIPSVDALRLRIELGAISDETTFHDAGTGKWGRAADHEIYRTLRRELGDEGGSGFHPPDARSDGGEEAAAAPVTQFSGEPAPEPFPEPDVSPPSVEPSDSEPPEEDGLPPSIHMEGLETSGGIPFMEAEEGWPDIEFPTDSDGPEGLEAAEAALHGELPGEETDRSPADAGLDGLELEPTLAEVFDAVPEDSPPAAAPSQPLSAYDEDQPPDWVQKEGPQDWAAVTQDTPDLAWRGDDPAATSGYDADAPAQDVRPRPQPRPRRAPPPRRLTRAGTPGIGRVVALVAGAVVVGAAGWFGLDYMALRSGDGTSVIPGVGLPSLPAELVPSMQEATARARARVTAALEDLPEREAIPAAPNRDWLSGAYLAGAGDFPDVADYWGRIVTFASAAQAAETELFGAALEAEVGALGLPETETDRVTVRAMAEWDAVESRRGDVYDQLRAVARAAQDLHTFLAANQDQISYEPAAGGVSRDPVLEAVPDTPALKEAMEDRVDAVTGSLRELGYLDTMNTTGLLGAFLAKLESVRFGA